ncbi:MAG: hypothetical protein K1X79_06660 [Oligoflexia bacterium]|nr:hypothetical protein [Oligoflexia bacterium]
MSSKSPLQVLRTAYAVGQESLSDYSHVKSPHKFTQAQLFACLVLKVFLGTDYRGVCEFLKDCHEFRAEIGLRQVPHFTTLQKRAGTLLTLPSARELLLQSVAKAKKNRL